MTELGRDIIKPLFMRLAEEQVDEDRVAEALAYYTCLWLAMIGVEDPEAALEEIAQCMGGLRESQRSAGLDVWQQLRDESATLQ